MRKSKECPCHDLKQCGLHNYLCADESCECTCPVPDPFGDTPVACVHCGAVFVAAMVVTDEDAFQKAIKSGKPFEGELCKVCNDRDIIIGCRKMKGITSTWRFLRGPLRVPRIPEPKSKGAKG